MFLTSQWRQRDDVVVLVFTARESSVCFLPVSFNRVSDRFCDLTALLKCVFYSLKNARTDRRLSSFQRSFARSTEKNMDVKAMEASLIKDNPVLLPLNKEKTVYSGFITVQASIYSCILDISLTNYIKICTVVKFGRQLDVSYSCFFSLALAR